jgi:hypothetical protein
MPGTLNQLFGDRCVISPVSLWKKPGTTHLAVERPRPSPVPELKAAISAVWASLERHLCDEPHLCFRHRRESHGLHERGLDARRSRNPARILHVDTVIEGCSISCVYPDMDEKVCYLAMIGSGQP